MEKDNYFNNNKKGMTLIETLVAVAIFVIMVGAISGLFISGIRIQKRILAKQELISQASYIIDYMSRSIRMARKQVGAADPIVCLTSDGLNYEIPFAYREFGDPTLGWGIRFINYEGTACQEFSLSGTKLIEDKAGVQLDLTSNKITVNSFRVSLSGAPQSDDLQPMVTLSLDISSKEGDIVRVQTSVSQRNLDFDY